MDMQSKVLGKSDFSMFLFDKLLARAIAEIKAIECKPVGKYLEERGN
jgi:hypothetical protein